MPIKADLFGKISKTAVGGPGGLTLSGSGTYEFHRAARMLPAASEVAGATP